MYPRQIRNLDIGQSHLHHPTQPWTVSSISLPLNLLGDEDIASQGQNDIISITTKESEGESSTARSRFSLFSKQKVRKASKGNKAAPATRKEIDSKQSQCTLEPQAYRPVRSSFRSSFASFFDILRFKNGPAHRRSSAFRASKPEFLFSSVDGLSSMTDSSTCHEGINPGLCSNNDVARPLPLQPRPLSPTPPKFKSKRSPHMYSLGVKSLSPPPRPKRPSYKPVRSPQQYKDSGITRTQSYYPLVVVSNERFRTFSDQPLSSSGSKKKKAPVCATVEQARTIHNPPSREVSPPWNNTAKPLSRIVTTTKRPPREGRQLFEYETTPLRPPNSPFHLEPKQLVIISPQDLLHLQHLNGHGDSNAASSSTSTSTLAHGDRRQVKKTPSFKSCGARTAQSTSLLGGGHFKPTATHVANHSSSNDRRGPNNTDSIGHIDGDEETASINNNDSKKLAVVQAGDIAFELIKPLDMNKIQAQRARRAKATYSAYIRHRSQKTPAA